MTLCIQKQVRKIKLDILSLKFGMAFVCPFIVSITVNDDQKM